MKQTVLIAALLAMALLQSAVVARGAYKWVDQDGTVHYSDRLESSQAEVVNVPSEAPVSAHQPVPQGGDGSAAKQNTAASPQEGGQSQQGGSAATRKRNCQLARQRLQTYLRLGRLYRKDEQGQRHYLSDEERDEVIAKARQTVSEWCAD